MSRRSIDRNEDFLFQALDSIVKTLDVMRAEQAASCTDLNNMMPVLKTMNEESTSLEQQKP